MSILCVLIGTDYMGVWVFVFFLIVSNVTCATSLQLDLQMRETAGEVQVSWVLSSMDSWDLRLTPSCSQVGRRSVVPELLNRAGHVILTHTNFVKQRNDKFYRYIV